MRRLASIVLLAMLLLPTPGTAQSALPPAIAAQVDGCAAVAVSARRVTAAGCPGVGIVMIRLDPGAPDLLCHARAGRAQTPPRVCLRSGVASSAPAASAPVGAPRQKRAARARRATTPAPTPAVAASCHPAYEPAADGSCVPDVGDRSLTCADIDDGQFKLVRKRDDPYGLDASGVGNGITCDDIG